jgi:hypothetical protein
MERCIEKDSKGKWPIRKEKYGNTIKNMGKSRKSKGSNGRKQSYYDDDYNAGNKKLKKSKYSDSRKDKSVEKGMFIDWGTL